TGGTGTITWTVRLDSGTTPIFTTSGTASTASFSWDTSGVPAGAHTLRLTVQDGAGRTATATRNVTVAAGGTLRVAVTQPGADGATVSGTTWFVLWVENAAAGSKTYSLSVNGAVVATTNDTSSGPISIPWDTTKGGDGATTVIASARDSAGNTGSTPRVVNVANGRQLVASFTSPAEGATVSGNVTVGMSETGASGTPIVFTLTVDGVQIFNTSNTPGTATSASFNWNSNSVADGPHTLGLTVRDGAGHTATATRSVNVTTPPPLSVSFTSPAAGATVGGTITVSATAGPGTTGTLNWSVSVDDPRRPPDGTIVLCTPSGTATSISCSFDTTTVADGAHALTATVQDSTGRSGRATRSITVAQPSLTASITSPAEGTTVSGIVPIGMSEAGGTGTITWTLHLDGGTTPIFTTSGTASTITFNWDTSTVSSGIHRLDLTVQDGGGRTATTTRNVTVGSPGTIKVFITQPSTDGTTVSGTVWFTIWLENAATGTRNLTLSIDGTVVATTPTTSNGPISMPWNTAGASGGTHTATVSVRDAANNTGSANRTVVTQGPATLTASFTSPADGATVSGMVTVGMAASGASGTPISFTLSVDGGAPIFSNSGAATTASFGWNSNSVPNGAHTLNLTVQDGAGRTATATRNVTVTSPPPIGVQFTSPTEGATVGGTITVAASLSGGATAPFTWTVKVDNTTQIFTSTGSPTSISFAWNTATVADGPHTLNVSVQDSTGATASAVRNITVTQPSPSTIKVFITQPNADGATVRGTVWFTIWIENAAAGTKTFTMSVDGTTVGTTNATSNGPISMPWTTNGTPNGSHSVTISVRDSAGGTGSAVRVVNVAN
ncbi:MAG TPA: Ig-like domain-containing protein, partial [Methylomirabilota bacterium]